MTRFRRAGSRWRLLVHHMVSGGRNDVSHHIGVEHHAAFQDSETARSHEFPGTEFDELVVGSWLHVEESGPVGGYYVAVGGVHVQVIADRDGRPTFVRVYSPGVFDNALPEVKYELDEKPWPGVTS